MAPNHDERRAVASVQRTAGPEIRRFWIQGVHGERSQSCWLWRYSPRKQNNVSDGCAVRPHNPDRPSAGEAGLHLAVQIALWLLACVAELGVWLVRGYSFPT